MMRTELVKHIGCTAAALAIAACGSDTTSPTGGSLDLAPVLAEISTGSSASFSGTPVASVSAGTAASTAWVPSSCTYASTTHAFTCPTITSGGLTITRSFFLYDASGGAQSAADAATTASVRTVTDISGTLAPPPGQNVSGAIAITRHDDITLSGLLAGKHTLNGTGTGHSDTQFTSGQTTSHFVVDETSKTTNLELPVNGGSSHFPQSGSIETTQTLTTTLGSAGPQTTNMHQVMTFDGTSVVTIEFTIGGTTRTCKFNFGNIAASVGCSL